MRNDMNAPVLRRFHTGPLREDNKDGKFVLYEAYEERIAEARENYKKGTRAYKPGGKFYNALLRQGRDKHEYDAVRRMPEQLQRALDSNFVKGAGRRSPYTDALHQTMMDAYEAGHRDGAKLKLEKSTGAGREI